MRTAIAAIATLAIAIAGTPSIAAGQEDQDRQAATSPAQPLRSQAQLTAWLEANAGRPTPFDRLSPGARERFFLDLDWGSRGLTGFDHTDLVHELTQEEVRELLSLFGPEWESFSTQVQPSAPRQPPVRDNDAALSDLERRYNQYYRVTLTAELDSADGTRAVSDSFDASFPQALDPAALQRLADHDLQLLSRAASVAARYSPADRYTDALRNAFLERERRGTAEAGDLRELRDALLADRRFDEARALGEAHPDTGLAPLPEFRDPIGPDIGGPTVWRLDAGGTALIRATIDLSPTQILVTAGCHFSKDAAEDISADPVLGPVFAEHAQWLVPAPGIESIVAARDWNRRFPGAQVAMIHDRAEWKLFPDWRMPAFHIVRNGRIIDSVVGWPRDPTVNREPLIAALRRAGLAKNASEAD